MKKLFIYLFVVCITAPVELAFASSTNEVESKTESVFKKKKPKKAKKRKAPKNVH